MNRIVKLKRTEIVRETQNYALKQEMIAFKKYLCSEKFTSNPCENYVNTHEVFSFIDRLNEIMGDADDRIAAPVEKEGA